MKAIGILLTAIFCFALASPLLAYMPQEESVKKKDVPKAILDSFEKTYPKAKIDGFSKETENGKTVYEVESVEGKIHRDITYNTDGSVIALEETLPVGDFPEAVRASLTKEFPKAKVVKAEKVTEGTTIHFEVLLKTGKKSSEVVFDAAGKVIKNEKKEKGEEKD